MTDAPSRTAAAGVFHPHTPGGYLQTKDGAHVVIRQAGVKDLPGCAKIINDYIDATDWLPRTHSRARIAAMFGPNVLTSRQIFVAVHKDEVVGYASFNPGAAFLAALYLVEDARGTGIGAMLLDAVKAAAPTGFALTVWHPNTAAQRFYHREGFRVTGEGVDDEGLPVWHLRWPGASSHHSRPQKA